MYIYLIFDTISRLTKIGKSSNPLKRAKSIKTANPHAELFFYSEEYTESELHDRFKHKREVWEWFALDKHDIYSITKTFGCIPKRLHYSNTKKDLKRKEILKIKNNLLKQDLKWLIKGYPDYAVTYNKIVYNVKRNKPIKKCYKSRSVGYWLNGKFHSINELRPLLQEIKEVKKEPLPF